MPEGNINYEALKAERNRLKGMLDAYPDMKHSRTYQVIKRQHAEVQQKISQLFKDYHARPTTK